MKSRNEEAIFDSRVEERRQLVTFLRTRGIKCPSVLESLQKVPRHHFIPSNHQSEAYADNPLPIGGSQTISQPYIVAAMTEALELTPQSRVLEIGTGSGYQTAILAELVAEVYTIEIISALSHLAQTKLGDLNYTNINFKVGDGFDGWIEAAPFDAIIVTAAPPKIPQYLPHQLKEWAKMIIPVGAYSQDLLLLENVEGDMEWEKMMPVAFVPMTGKAQNM